MIDDPLPDLPPYRSKRTGSSPLKHELAQFPNRKHKDQVDALSQGLLWLNNSSGPEHWLWMKKKMDRMKREKSSILLENCSSAAGSHSSRKTMG